MSPRVRTGVDYAPADPPGSRGHQLDLYLPDGAGPWPLLIVCGGSAFLGDGGSYYAAEVAPFFIEAGVAGGGGGTRAGPPAPLPAPLDDGKAAIPGPRAPPPRHGGRPGPV